MIELDPSITRTLVDMLDDVASGRTVVSNAKLDALSEDSTLSVRILVMEESFYHEQFWTWINSIKGLKIVPIEED